MPKGFRPRCGCRSRNSYTSLACLPLPLLAQVRERPIRLVVTGGLQLPTGNFADYHDYGVHADVGVLFSIAGMRFRPELSYSRFNIKDDFDIPSILRQSGAAAAGAARRARRFLKVFARDLRPIVAHGRLVSRGGRGRPLR